MTLILYITNFNIVYKFINNQWGISSNGRADALHASGRGIDALIFHKNNNINNIMYIII